MTDKKTIDLDAIFCIEEILPDSTAFFEDAPLSIVEEIESALIVLDTNVLLMPYGTAADSLSQIVEVYEKIKNRGCLCIPAQVGREFVKNRPAKLSELYQGIPNKTSKIQIIEKLSYPILESESVYNDLNQKIAELQTLKKEINELSNKVRQVIKEWGWNDLVSQAYRPIFTADVIVSPQYDKKELFEEMRKRYSQKIPPGYKDQSKDDMGIGDFLIWKTILHLGRNEKKSVVFVSGDEKADWMNGAEGNGFLPRYELQAEFRRESNGKDIYIIPLSRLLELEKADNKSVEVVRSEERRIREALLVTTTCPECGMNGDYELAEALGSSAFPQCSTCGTKFHLHRTSNGISAHRFNGTQKHSDEKKVEIVFCPACSALNFKELGTSPNSTGWCICDDCSTNFPIHRKIDGSVYVKSLEDNL